MKRALLILAATAAISAPALANEDTAKDKDCVTCHAVDKKPTGHAHKNAAKKHVGNAKAAKTKGSHDRANDPHADQPSGQQR
jgi:cytochrome c